MKLHGTNNLLYQFGLVKYNNEVNEILSAIPKNPKLRFLKTLLFPFARKIFEDVPATILDADFPLIIRAWRQVFQNRVA